MVFNTDMQQAIESIIGKYPGKNRENLLSILQDVQKEFGFIPEKSIELISEVLNLPTSKIYGIATFYNEFSFEKLGRFHVRVCVGTGCHLAGSGKIVEEFSDLLGIEAGQTTKDLNFSLQTVPCIGACGIAPIVAVNDEFYSAVKREDVAEIIDNYKNQID